MATMANIIRSFIFLSIIFTDYFVPNKISVMNVGIEKNRNLNLNIFFKNLNPWTFDALQILKYLLYIKNETNNKYVGNEFENISNLMKYII